MLFDVVIQGVGVQPTTTPTWNAEFDFRNELNVNRQPSDPVFQNGNAAMNMDCKFRFPGQLCVPEHVVCTANPLKNSVYYVAMNFSVAVC